MTDFLLDAWAAVMWKACWQGSLVVLAVWLICLVIPSMPARCRCWLWRLAILKFMVVLLLPTLGQSAAASCPSGCQPHARGCRSDRQATSSNRPNRTKLISIRAGQLNCQVFRRSWLFSGSSGLAGHWLAFWLLGGGHGNYASRAALSTTRR